MVAIGIAFLHGLAVFMAWAMSGGSKGVAVVGAILSGMAAIAKGQLLYLPLDLLGIAAGWFLVTIMSPSPEETTTQAYVEPPEKGEWRRAPFPTPRPPPPSSAHLKTSEPLALVRQSQSQQIWPASHKDLRISSREADALIERAMAEANAAITWTAEGKRMINLSKCPTYRLLASYNEHPVIKSRWALWREQRAQQPE